MDVRTNGRGKEGAWPSKTSQEIGDALRPNTDWTTPRSIVVSTFYRPLALRVSVDDERYQDGGVAAPGLTEPTQKANFLDLASNTQKGFARVGGYF